MITYLGMQDDNIIYANTSRQEVENLPNIILTEIIETEELVELVDGNYYVGENNIKEAKQKEVRSTRNYYLEIYVDPVVSNPLRWADLDINTKKEYVNYRKYLLDYTNQESWWENEPLTFEEWKIEENKEE